MGYYQIQRADNEPYMPSNGSEGSWFHSKWCDKCIHQHPDSFKKPQCDEILLESLIGNQPAEWIYLNNNPTCTAFVKWDWGNDGDPDDDNNPKAPIPVAPNQLMLFSVADEILQNSDVKQESSAYV